MRDAYREGTPEAWRVARRQPVPPRTHTSVYRKVIEYAASLWVPVWKDSARTTATSPYLRVAIKRRSNSSRVIWPLSASSQARFPAGSANHPAVVIRKSSRRTSAAAARSPRRRASNSSRSARSRSSTRGDPIHSKPKRRLRQCPANDARAESLRCGADEWAHQARFQTVASLRGACGARACARPAVRFARSRARRS
jgi:hypothetical protein